MESREKGVICSKMKAGKSAYFFVSKIKLSVAFSLYIMYNRCCITLRFFMVNVQRLTGKKRLDRKKYILQKENAV